MHTCANYRESEIIGRRDAAVERSLCLLSMRALQGAECKGRADIIVENSVSQHMQDLASI
jgi:hypothetical protein